jgi:uncharacterized protein (DUF1697 family)
MTTFVALLRAVNLAGRNKVRMADLRDFFLTLGMQDVETLLQSGNVVFASGRRSGSALEQLFEREAARQLGLQTSFLVRTAAQWKAIIAGNPFPEEAEADPSHLLVVCMKDAPKRTSVANLRSAIRGRERVVVKGRQAYFVYPDGIGRSRLTAAVIERHLRAGGGTGRNWNTVLKLGALVGVG